MLTHGGNGHLAFVRVGQRVGPTEFERHLRILGDSDEGGQADLDRLGEQLDRTLGVVLLGQQALRRTQAVSLEQTDNVLLLVAIELGFPRHVLTPFGKK